MSPEPQLHAYHASHSPDTFRLLEFAGGHGCLAAVRADCYAWLDRWLQPKNG